MPKELSKQAVAMYVVHDNRTNIIAEEPEDGDRISNLPDDIIHRILSFIDMKYAVQASTLSRRWRHIWNSMPYLKLNRRMLGKVARFTKFVDHALSQRNNETEVSEVELRFTGVTSQRFVKDIVSYAYLHNVRKLTIICSCQKYEELPEYLFLSHSLEHFTLSFEGRGQNTYIPASAWDFPVLKTLSLSNICFISVQKSFDLFSKCVNLQDITFRGFTIYVDEFNVFCPQLSNLTITAGYQYPKVFKVFAPKLKNLTASVMDINHSILEPTFFDCLQSTQGFDSLETVNLFLSPENNFKKIDVPMLLSAFQKLRSAKFLILNSEFIEVLGSDLDQLSHAPCPFNNLKCVKIGTAPLSRKDHISKLENPVKDYLLKNSPNASFIMDLPQKRPWELLYNVEKSKVAKLEEKIQVQDEVIVEHKSVHETLLSYIIKCKMSELRVQVEAGNPDYEIVRAMGSEIKSVMDSMPKNLRLNVEAQFFSQYEAMKSLLLTRIDASRSAKIEAELGSLRHSNVS